MPNSRLGRGQSQATAYEQLLEKHELAVKAAQENPILSPETGARLSRTTAVRFGAGFLMFGVLWMSGLGIVSTVLLPQHYKSIPGIEPAALLGVVNAATAVASLISNLVFGNFSDRTRSRLGRRTPWILGGAVVGGLTLFLTGTTSNPVLLTIYYCICMGGLNCMIAPMTAVISDRVPSGIRGTMSAFYGAGATIGAPIGALLGACFILDLLPGFALAGVLMFLGGVVAVAIMPREQGAEYLPRQQGGWKEVFLSFKPPQIRKAPDFYKAFIGRFCMLVSYQMITAYQLYILQDYIHLSDRESGKVIAGISMITMVVSLLGSLTAGPLSDVIKRRKLPVIIASICFAIGVLMPWVVPSVIGMYLYAAIAGLGYGVYSSVDQALLVDVLPDKSTAGKDLGILNLATTLGQMVGPIIMSAIVLSVGYSFAFPVSIALALLGCVSIMFIRSVK